MKSFFKLLAFPFIWVYSVVFALLLFIVYIVLASIASLVNLCEDLF